MTHAPVSPHSPQSEPASLIRNAGLVLSIPFLPRLWMMLGLVEGEAFVDSAAAERAAKLMEYLAAQGGGVEQPTSALNLLLCGLPLNARMGGPITASPTEQDAIDGLLAAMIEHWKALGNTSLEGLRATFLRREGRMVRTADCWCLTIAPGPIDMLLDRLPWGYSVCKLAWMREALHVNWR